MQQTAEDLFDAPSAPGPSAPGSDEPPVVVVGNGPVGMRFVEELLGRAPGTPVVIYGAEPHLPYNRVRLSSWLAGELDLDGLAQPLRRPEGARVEERVGYRVERIDIDGRRVVDSSGRSQPYRRLVLATGSTPLIPHIPGIELAGVYTFRDLDDTNRLLARRLRSHRTVVLGGGLLGLEAARGMQRSHTRVTVVEHSDRLLGRQLDEDGAAFLKAEVERLGIEVVVGDAVAELVGDQRVAGVRLRSGALIPCDTLVVAAGIRPNIGLAVDARLAYGRGIRVDDAMRTSVPDVYAVGECAEHRGRIYGLVAPGLEQAAVAAANMVALEGSYGGSVAAARLKVVGTQVFSMGPMGEAEAEHPLNGVAHVYRGGGDVYRKVLIRRHRLVGAIGIGPWEETPRLQTFIGRERVVWPWQLLRFRRTGRLWPADEGQGVAAWPAAATVCQCTGVTRGGVDGAILQGACSVAEVSAATGAGTVCGSCKPLVQELLGAEAARQPAPMHRTLTAAALAALVGGLLLLLGPAIPYADTVQQAWRWDWLWRDELAKQVTGFTTLGLFALGLLLSPRKRVARLHGVGSFDAWRLAHLVLGLLAIVTLVAHTGLRLGHGLNLMLAAAFTATLLLGAVSTAAIAQEHRIGGALAGRLRRRSVLWHILLFWPVPALLGWHIFKTYWF